MANYPASDLDWNSIDNFSESEFIGVDLTELDEKVILSIVDFRARLGKSVYPSPVDGAFVRTEGSLTSRHYAVNRLSDAGDFFPKGHITEAFLTAIATGYGGIGLYLDTNYRDVPWPMIHLDNRKGQVFWICEKIDGVNVYTTFYPHKDPKVLRAILKKLSEVTICH